MKLARILMIENSGEPFRGIVRYGIRCEQGRDVLEIADISSRKAVVEAIIQLVQIGEVSVRQIQELVQSILGIII